MMNMVDVNKNEKDESSDMWNRLNNVFGGTRCIECDKEESHLEDNDYDSDDDSVENDDDSTYVDEDEERNN